MEIQVLLIQTLKFQYTVAEEGWMEEEMQVVITMQEGSTLEQQLIEWTLHSLHTRGSSQIRRPHRSTQRTGDTGS